VSACSTNADCAPSHYCETNTCGPCGIASGTANTTWQPGQSLYSCDGRFELTMQTDGNLVLYQVPITAPALWNSATQGNPGAFARMQSDGNLVVYAAGATRSLWNSATQGNPGAYLDVQTDGNLVIYNAGGTASLWNSGTCCH